MNGEKRDSQISQITQMRSSGFPAIAFNPVATV
jgi:hypothetical protein